MTYRPRQAPARFFAGAPDIVRAQVLDLIKISAAAPLDFDVLLRPTKDRDTRAPFYEWFIGVDFGNQGEQGQHFFLNAGQLRAYRDRHRRRARVAWSDLPADTQRAIVRYLESS